MRVAALGDAHLGRAYLPVTLDGVNVREHDFEISLDRAIELAVVQQPDLVVWLGDIFDHPRPSYRSFRVAQRALARLRDHGVAVVVITGNHDTPRLPGTGSPYSALADTFPEFHFAHRLAYERFELPGLVVHAVPQMLTVDDTLEALDRADRERSLDRTNLLLTHPRVPQVEPRYADINEIEVDAGRLQSDLVLLGHYHVHAEVRERVWYAGSTDTFTFAVVVLDTDSGECTHVALDGQRPLVTLPTVHALGMTPAELEASVLERLAEVPADAVARLYLEGVDAEAYRLLDRDALHDAGRAALHVKLEPQFVQVGELVAVPDLDAMPARWDRYLGEQDLTGYDRDRIRDLGHEYLSRAVEAAEP